MWHDNLVGRSCLGHFVRVASLEDEEEVVALTSEVVARSPFGEWKSDEAVVRKWTREIILSYLWLVLLLCDARGKVIGVAICQYIGYDMNVECRILKCKHLYVRPRTANSLRANCSLLIEAIVEAARRSPQVLDVFFVSFGGTRIDSFGKLLAKKGFTKIGTQHVGQVRGARVHDQLREVKKLEDLDEAEQARVCELAYAFFRESDRSTLGMETPNFHYFVARAFQQAEKSCNMLAYDNGQIIGFLSAHIVAIPLTSMQFLQNSFFYIEPDFRGSSISIRMFDSLSTKAEELGLNGVYFGTSGLINVERVSRLLDLRGYRRKGDVYALRVAPTLCQQ